MLSYVKQSLRGVHHVGVTVANMAKALEFYTEVLGGRLVIIEKGLKGDVMHNTLLQKEELDAVRLQVAPASIGVPNLRDGLEVLDVCFIQFEVDYDNYFLCTSFFL